MELLLCLAVAFAAFCVWLTVRIVNRRERWAKWTAAATLLMAAIGYFGAYFTMADVPLAYSLSGSGPWRLPPRYRIGMVKLDKPWERFFSPVTDAPIAFGPKRE